MTKMDKVKKDYYIAIEKYNKAHYEATAFLEGKKRITIIWEEYGDRDLKNVKKIAAGINYFKYEKEFNDLREVINFWNQQLNRKIFNKITILEVKANAKS